MCVWWHLHKVLQVQHQWLTGHKLISRSKGLDIIPWTLYAPRHSVIEMASGTPVQCPICMQHKEFRKMFMWLDPEESTLHNTMRWCAQQRIASMYRDTILHVGELDPGFIFMGDDDTSIDPVQLALYLQRCVEAGQSPDIRPWTNYCMV